MSVLTEILTRLVSGWKWALGAAAGIAVLFYRWRAEANRDKAQKAIDHANYLQDKARAQSRVDDKMQVKREIHEKERENLRKRRREGQRGGGLGKW